MVLFVGGSFPLLGGLSRGLADGDACARGRNARRCGHSGSRRLGFAVSVGARYSRFGADTSAALLAVEVGLGRWHGSDSAAIGR